MSKNGGGSTCRLSLPRLGVEPMVTVECIRYNFVGTETRKSQRTAPVAQGGCMNYHNCGGTQALLTLSISIEQGYNCPECGNRQTVERGVA